MREAKLDIYSQIAPDRSDEWVKRRLFEPLSWISFLYRQLIEEARKRKPKTIIVGVVERGGELREFSETILLKRIFRNLRDKGNENYFNNLYDRKDITSEKALLDRLGYTDALLLSMLLEPGQFSEPWEIQNKYAGLTKGKISLPDESYTTDADVRFVLKKPRNGGNSGSSKVIQYGLSSHFNPLLDDNLFVLWVRTLFKSHPAGAAVKASPLR